MSCAHCPRSGRACAGQEIPRLCELVDPAGPDHNPAYEAALDPASLDPDAPDAPPAAAVADAPPPAAALEGVRRGLRNCEREQAEPPACGCVGSVFCRANGRDVVLLDCLACLGIWTAKADSAA
jgi:hypothetical protein